MSNVHNIGDEYSYTLCVRGWDGHVGRGLERVMPLFEWMIASFWLDNRQRADVLVIDLVCYWNPFAWLQQRHYEGDGGASTALFFFRRITSRGGLGA